MHFPHLKQSALQGCCKNKIMYGKHVAQSINQTVNQLSLLAIIKLVNGTSTCFWTAWLPYCLIRGRNSENSWEEKMEWNRIRYVRKRKTFFKTQVLFFFKTQRLDFEFQQSRFFTSLLDISKILNKWFGLLLLSDLTCKIRRYNLSWYFEKQVTKYNWLKQLKLIFLL